MDGRAMAPVLEASMIACRVPAAMLGAVILGALIFGATAPWSGPAAAQFFGGDQPPRPPGAVPGRPAAQPQPQIQPPQQPQAQPSPPPFNQGTLLPPGPPPGRSGVQSSAVQSQDLPPPPGAALAPPGPPPTVLPRPGAPAQALPPGPGQRPQGANPPGAAAPPPEDVVTQPPTQKIVNPKAVFAGLDKITGRITAFDAAIGETVQFGALQVTPRACYTRPPTETPLTDGFVEVAEVTLQGEVRRIFTGWMFAASPGLHAVEHAIYDVWLTDCKGGVQAVAEAPPPPVAAPAARPPAQQRPPAPQRQPQPPRQPPTGAVLQPPLIR
jgi:hypothetical protein